MSHRTTWHETDCARPDVVLYDSIPTCMSCGSVFTAALLEPVLRRGDLSATTPSSDRSNLTNLLNLDWPSSIAFSCVEDTDDAATRTALMWLERIHIEPLLLDFLHGARAARQKVTNQLLETIWEGLMKNTSRDTGKRIEIVHATPLEYMSAVRQSAQDPPVFNKSAMYRSLTGADQVRLLLLSPSTSGEILHGTLLPTSLSDRPDFTALSYTWADASGSRARSEIIFLGANWIPLAITVNCAAALRRLRNTKDKCVVWVDAICIDQDDTTERSHQVSLMRDIYSRASRVFMFLGNDGDQQTFDGALMSRMSEECFYGGPTTQIFWTWKRDHAGLKSLFDRPYWSRIWVIQEVLLSKQAVVVLSDKVVPLASILGGQMTDGNAKEYFPAWTQLTRPSVQAYGDVDAMSELLLKTSLCHASDARDNIFALLGLVSGAHLEGLVADYGKTVQEIYTGISAYFLVRHGQTKILKWAAASKASAPTAEWLSWVPTTKWLSWVPTWTAATGSSQQASIASLHPIPEIDNDFQFWDAVVPGHPSRSSGCKQ